MTWIVKWCETLECDGPATEDPDEPGTCDECGQPLVDVEVIRADTYRATLARVEGVSDRLRDLNVALRERLDEATRELERRRSNA